MKKIVFVFAALLLIAGCEKPDHSKDVLNSVCDGIRGKYVCKSITFLGEPIDVNGDGKCSTDLMKEFGGLNNCMRAVNAYQRIYPSPEYNEECFIDIEIPFQDIAYDKRTDEYTPRITGSAMYVVFSYMVDESGDVTFNIYPEPDTSWWSDIETDHHDMQYTYIDRIVKLGGGVMELVINCAFYDYSTRTFIKGRAEYTYERVSYSI